MTPIFGLKCAACIRAGWRLKAIGAYDSMAGTPFACIASQGAWKRFYFGFLGSNKHQKRLIYEVKA